MEIAIPVYDGFTALDAIGPYLLDGAELAQALQLAIEYDPEPPFEAGSPEKAPGEIVDKVRAGTMAWQIERKERREARG